MKQLIIFIMLLLSGVSKADTLDSLRLELDQHPQVQEKIYVHTDNTCYFVGDTIWYKAYVVRSDNYMPTDMSRILYVELLSADGIVVERQRVVVSGTGYTCGDFALQDSLYSGYYELRAYTRWQLNFNVGHKDYTVDDTRRFYNRRMAKDFFRDWEGLYSRVIPVYSKPQAAGDYSGKYMYARPKQNLMKTAKENLTVNFFPEGGAMVTGQRCRVAFEAHDQEGQNVEVEGRLSDGTALKTSFQGRGVFEFTPSANTTKATFTHNGKTYTFQLPQAETQGVALAVSNGKISVSPSSSAPYALVIVCRGKMYAFERGSGKKTIDIPTALLPTGINEAIVYDSQARPVASRLFFVNHNDKAAKATVKTDKEQVEPYGRVSLTIDAAPSSLPLSVAVRDGSTDDDSYDNGNMLTEMLLSSELKGFIAYPAYYFEADDKEHRDALDLLMMVQGWRRYKRVDNLRYEPETTFTIEGAVYRTLNVIMADEDNVSDGTGTSRAADIAMADAMAITNQSQGSGIRKSGYSYRTKQDAAVSGSKEFYSNDSDDDDEEGDDDSDSESETTDDTEESVEYANELGENHGSLKKEVLVEAEIDKGGTSAGVVQRTHDHGRFMIQIPPFYDKAILFLRAYAVKDSLKKRMGGRNETDFANERAYPDYFVKQDLFYPIYSQPYSYYQVNEPPYVSTAEAGDDGKWEIGGDKKSKLDGDHQLQNVNVKGKRRGKRGVDYTKPAFVMDAYDVYNYVTDYGLSYGVVDFRNFPMQVATFLYGNMGRGNIFNVRGIIDGTSFYRNYTPSSYEYDKHVTPKALAQDMQLRRVLNVRAFSDYEPRNENGIVENHSDPDVTLVFETIPDDQKRYTYRDRRYVLRGFNRADEFYNPDYSQRQPAEPTDYRRTLYWNPNATLDANGHFETSFYGNSKETRIKVSVAGITDEGKFIVKE